MDEVIIVDDEIILLSSLTLEIRCLGYNPKGFDDFLEAEDYIKQQKQLSVAYFVDMKPMSNVPVNPDTIEKKVLEAPERLFNLVKNVGGAERFYFMSGHRSFHDEKVLARTNANYISKMDIYGYIDRILRQR